jgi:hypothetical protein
MRNHFRALMITSAIALCISQPLAAQGGRRTGGGAAPATGCATPLASPGPRCVRPFPDSLALTAAQKQSIASLRENFAKAHAAEFAQLRQYGQYGRSAGQTGSPAARSGAMPAQADSIRKALRPAQKQLELREEATLTPAQQQYVKAGRPTKRGAPRRP